MADAVLLEAGVDRIALEGDFAAPTFVAEYEATAGWDDATTPKTVSITTAVGDVLVHGSANAGHVTGGLPGPALNLPTGGTPTYANQENLSANDYSRVRIDTAVTGITAQTYTLSQTYGGTVELWGFNCVRFSGSSGIGAAESVNTTGAPSLNITTTQAKSALVVVVADWSAQDGASRVWRTVNGFTPTAGNGQEVSYFRNTTNYAAYMAYYPDAGDVGVKTVGLSAPGGQTYVIAAVEVKGTLVAGSGVVLLEVHTAAFMFGEPARRLRRIRVAG